VAKKISLSGGPLRPCFHAVDRSHHAAAQRSDRECGRHVQLHRSFRGGRDRAGHAADPRAARGERRRLWAGHEPSHRGEPGAGVGAALREASEIDPRYGGSLNADSLF
jgi:hypothetical protein